ncbi:MAG: amino acid ABC transporter permease [Thermoplasmata archaeon]
MRQLGRRMLDALSRWLRLAAYAFWPLFLILLAVVSLVGILSVLGIVDLAFIRRVSPLLVRGTTITLAATAVILPLSFVLGFFVGWGRIAENPMAYWVSTFFVEVFRGTPQLVVLMVGFFVFLPLFAGGIDLTSFAFWAGTIALAMHSAAYQAEIFRNGFQSVPSGQIEAAHALGLSSWQTMRSVIFPQAFRVSLPPLGNEFANIVKDSSLISLLGVLDLTGWGKQFQAIPPFLVTKDIFNWIVIAIIYFVLIYVLTAAMLAMERRMRVPGLEEAP